MPEPEIELAWAAGFFDGEGCVRFRQEKGPSRPEKSRSYGNVCIAVSQVHKEPLDRFLTAVGLGKIYGPYQNRGGKHKPHFVYSAWGDTAIEVFQRLRPYLSSIKIKDGDAAIALLAIQRAQPRLGNGQYGRKRGPYKRKDALNAAA